MKNITLAVVALFAVACHRDLGGSYVCEDAGTVPDLAGPVYSDWDGDTTCIDPCYEDADMSTPADMTTVVVADLSDPVDLTPPVDMTVLPDLTVLADMTMLPDMTCVPAPYTPTVQLLIDQSGSMGTKDSGNTLTRWQLVQYALTDSSVGVLNALQADVLFGATLFTTAKGICPSLNVLAPVIDNAAAIQQLLASHSPSGNTPTAASVAATSSYVQGLPGAAGTKFIVLATDGLPNTCSSSTDDTANTVTAIKAAYDAGIVVYVLGVGPDTSNANLQAMANAGQGVASGAVFYRGTSPSDLVAAFNTIISDARGCNK